MAPEMTVGDLQKIHVDRLILDGGDKVKKGIKGFFGKVVAFFQGTSAKAQNQKVWDKLKGVLAGKYGDDITKQMVDKYDTSKPLSSRRAVQILKEAEAVKDFRELWGKPFADKAISEVVTKNNELGREISLADLSEEQIDQINRKAFELYHKDFVERFVDTSPEDKKKVKTEKEVDSPKKVELKKEPKKKEIPKEDKKSLFDAPADKSTQKMPEYKGFKEDDVVQLKKYKVSAEEANKLVNDYKAKNINLKADEVVLLKQGFSLKLAQKLLKKHGTNTVLGFIDRNCNKRQIQFFLTNKFAENWRDPKYLDAFSKSFSIKQIQNIAIKNYKQGEGLKDLQKTFNDYIGKGISPDEAVDLYKAEIYPDEVQKNMDVYDRIIEQYGHSPKDASAYKKNFNVWQAMKLMKAKIPAEKAIKAAANLKKLTANVDYAIGLIKAGISAEEAKQYLDKGFNVNWAITLHKNKIPADNAMPYKNFLFSLKDTIKLVKMEMKWDTIDKNFLKSIKSNINWLKPDGAIRLIKAGVTYKEAGLFEKNGFSVDQTLTLKYLTDYKKEGWTYKDLVANLSDPKKFKAWRENQLKAWANKYDLSDTLLFEAAGMKPADVEKMGKDAAKAYISMRLPYSEDTKIVGTIVGGAKKIGGGQFNIVFSGAYKSNGKMIPVAFKDVPVTPEKEEYSAKISGVNMRNPRYGLRNIAAYKLAKKLGCAHLITETSIGMHEGKLKIFMEKVEGKDIFEKKTEVIEVTDKTILDVFENEKKAGNLKPLKDQEKFLDTLAKKYGLKKLYIDSKDSKLKAEIETGEYEIEDRNLFKQPALIKDLTGLQWLDVLTGQLDRHGRNYMMKRDAKGNIKGLVGIDNDQAFGKDIKDPNDLKKYVGHSCGMPKVIDKDLAEKFNKLDEGELENMLKGLLTSEEISAAKSRLRGIKQYIKGLDKKHVIEKDKDWSEGLFNQFKAEDHYVSRDKMQRTVNGYTAIYTEELKKRPIGKLA